jgi:hypothetical protein
MKLEIKNRRFILNGKTMRFVNEFDGLVLLKEDKEPNVKPEERESKFFVYDKKTDSVKRLKKGDEPLEWAREVKDKIKKREEKKEKEKKEKEKKEKEKKEKEKKAERKK